MKKHATLTTDQKEEAKSHFITWYGGEGSKFLGFFNKDKLSQVRNVYQSALASVVSDRKHKNHRKLNSINVCFFLLWKKSQGLAQEKEALPSVRDPHTASLFSQPQQHVASMWGTRALLQAQSGRRRRDRPSLKGLLPEVSHNTSM